MTKVSLYAFILALVCLLGIIILAVTNTSIPSVLEWSLSGLLGLGGGASWPSPPNDPSIPPK